MMRPCYLIAKLELVESSCSSHTSDTQCRNSRFRQPHSLPRLPVEADVNVLVVGSSTARRGAIGRHFPLHVLSLIWGTGCYASLGRTLGKRSWGRAHRAELPEGSWGMCVYACACVCVAGGEREGSTCPVSLLIWRTWAGKADGPGAPVAPVCLHQHGGRNPPSPRLPKGSGTI